MITSVRARISRMASRKRSPSCDARPSSSRTCRWITLAPAFAHALGLGGRARRRVSGRCGFCARVVSAPTMAAVMMHGPGRPTTSLRRTFSGTTQVPRARQTTIGSASRSADDSKVSSRARRRHDHLARDELHAERGLAPARDGPLGLDEVAGAHRRQELDRVVGAEQPFVAVGADAQLGGDVAEQLQHLRAVDEPAGVVRVVRSHSNSYARFHFGSPMC